MTRVLAVELHWPGFGATDLLREAAALAYNEGKRTLGMVTSLSDAISGRNVNSLSSAFENWWQGETDVATATGKMNDELGKANSAYQTLIASIRSKIEENKLETAVGENATESDKIRIKVIQELTSGKLNLAAAQKATVDQALKVLAVSEKELAMSKLLAAADKEKLDLSAQAVKSAFDEARKNQGPRPDLQHVTGCPGAADDRAARRSACTERGFEADR